MTHRAIEQYVERMGPFPANTVSFVGVGPGDAGLLTVRGACRIQQADVILHAAGETPSWRPLVRADAQMIFAGRKDGSERIKPADFLAIAKPHVDLGRRVVRLKSGDPFIFNRSEEECIALREAGIGFEIVPGVTSGLAGAEFAGIGVAYPGMADAVTLVIGYENPEADAARVDYRRLAAGGTVIVYFGEQHLGGICRHLIAKGVSKDLPVAVITDATHARQSVDIGTVVSFQNSPGAPRPSVIVIGEAVRTHEMLAWREGLPLSGQTVLVTRPSELVGPLVGTLSAAGAEVLEASMVRIGRLTDDAVLREAVTNIDRYDWVVLTSVNGVDTLATRLQAASMDGRSLGGVRLAVVGPASAKRLGELFLTADLMPDRYLTSELGQALVDHGVNGSRILLIRSSEASDTLPVMLEQAGARCDDLVGYRVAAPNDFSEKITNELMNDSIHWGIFTSPSTFSNFTDLLKQRGIAHPESMKLASIGPVTSAAMRQAGFEPTIEADIHTSRRVAQTIIDTQRASRND